LSRSCSLLALSLLAACGAPTQGPGAAAKPPPNILLILTDDQGYGDLGAHGNPEIRTPRLDAFARESIRVERFYVSPVCSPTRASLLTGRWNYRTGVVDTYLGRSMMFGDEATLAEMLAPTHRTGLFGKWHLGDNYPMRAQDQGFQKVLSIKGGGIGQPSDPPGGDHYQNPTLYRQGWPTKMSGYVTDLITDGALEFIRESSSPFFAFVAYNAPHTPLEVPEGYLQKYLDAGLSETTAKIYAMVENIDWNVGRLLDALERKQAARDTIVIFMTDNGPQQPRYNANLRGLKGTVFEGGIRVPFYLRWPAALRGGRAVPGPGAHVDLLPTMLDACGVPLARTSRLDGISLLPHLKGAPSPHRTIFLQWHRGDRPETGRSFTVIDPRWKLVGAKAGEPRMLFDLEADPFEKNDLASEQPGKVSEMEAAYQAWFKEMEEERRFQLPRIHVGYEAENPTVLTRQDWRGPQAGAGAAAVGYWDLQCERSLKFRVTLRFKPFPADGSALLKIGGQKASALVRAGQSLAVMDLAMRTGQARLEVVLSAGDLTSGPTHVELLRLD
jgi:arylsulfatase A-like enzyme